MTYLSTGHEEARRSGTPGFRTRWKEKVRFIDYFTIVDKTLTRYIPNFEYILIDISKFDDKLLKQ